MTRPRAGLATTLLLALVAAATTWASMLSWRGLTHDASRFLVPLLGVGLVVAVAGAAGRWWRVPLPALLAGQLALGAMGACWAVIGVPLPVGGAGAELSDAFRGAMDSAHQFRPPVPAGVPAVHPLLVAGGTACLVLVDLLACSLRRIPLAGLPLLTVLSVPISLLGGGMSWWVFALTAAGFLALLFLHESEEVAHWGRLLEDTNTDATGFGVRTGAARASAGTIGAAATALAIVAPVLVPTLDIDAFDLGPGNGGSGEIALENPITDMRRNLKRGQDVTLVRLQTDDPNPSYLRIAALTRFSENEWSSGDRDVPTDQVADGPMPPLEGVADSVRRQTHEYFVRVTSLFDSKWLPTQAPISAITAEGDWRYDATTMDFVSGDKEVGAGGMEYAMTAVDLDLDPKSLIASSSLGGPSQRFLDLPSTLPGMVRQLAASVTAAAPSKFEKAVVLQDWFRESGGFSYNTDVTLGSGADDLVDFLSEGPNGREGYCEQFASAMAVMARALGIPARVAVGFLRPDKVGPRTYEYSAWDLHAWPELFFEGAGWVAFEPTPPGRASNVPAYTRIDISDFPEPIAPSATANPSDDARPGPADDAPRPEASEESAEAGAGTSGFPWLPVAGGLTGAAVLLALLLLPHAVRGRRRRRRLGAGPEEVWAELRDSVLDLGLPWPDGRSPRETGAALSARVGDSAADLQTLVRAVELSRYAREGTPAPGELRPHAEACIAAMYDWASTGAQRRATWWPRSVFRRSGRDRLPVREVENTPSGVMEHVG